MKHLPRLQSDRSIALPQGSLSQSSGNRRQLRRSTASTPQGSFMIADLHDGIELQRAADPDLESPKYLPVRTSPPAAFHAPSLAIVASKTKKVSLLSFDLNIHVSDPSCRWPLVFRFIKGAIHVEILLPLFLHAIFTAFVVYLDTHVFDTVGLPNSIVCVPSSMLPRYFNSPLPNRSHHSPSW